MMTRMDWWSIGTRDRLGTMTSLEWDTLWRISLWDATRRSSPDAPVTRYRNEFRDRIPGSYSATTALIARGLVHSGPQGDALQTESLTPTARGRRLLTSTTGVRNKPRPRVEEGTVPDWLERSQRREWIPTEEQYERLWHLDQDGPAALTEDGALRDRNGWVHASVSASHVAELVTPQYAQRRGETLAITAAGREALGERPDLAVKLTATRTIRTRHRMRWASKDEELRAAVPEDKSMFVCECGYYFVDQHSTSRVWADENPAAGHWAMMIDAESLEIARAAVAHGRARRR